MESRDARMVQLLLDYGADMGSFRLDKKRHRRAQRNPMRSVVEAVDDGQGALAQACRQGVPDIVVQLLDHGADADLIPLLVRSLNRVCLSATARPKRVTDGVAVWCVQEQCKPKCFQHVGWDVRQHFMTRLGFSQSSRTSSSSV